MYSKDNTLKLLKKLITQKLIEKQERYPTKENRYTELLKNPERTPVDNDEWFIYVPSYFNDCLDVVKTDRRIKTGRKIRDGKTGKMKEEKKIEKVWTQGSRFDFHRGCILYDTRKAYQSWSKGVNEIKYCISINSGKSARPAMDKDKRVPGEVEFSILTPNQQTKDLKEIGEFKLTQDEFVRFLINGDPNIIS